MADRDSRIRALGEHLKDRYIPFSEAKDGKMPTLDVTDAYGLAAVAIDFIENGYSSSTEDLKP